MRLAALAAPAVLIVAGAGYYVAKPKPYAGVPLAERMERPSAPSDDFADAADAELVRDAIGQPELSEGQRFTLVSAAGRRYMRRKLAYLDAKKRVDEGKGDAATLASLQQEMEQARRVCDLAESLGRRSHDLMVSARAGTELERRLWYSPSKVIGLADRFEGGSTFAETDLSKMEQAFQERFGRPLPVSTRGASSFHRAMGFDHSGRFDVAVSPDHVEGVWVRNYLSAKNVAFFAFRSAVRGQATGAHIHIGPASGHTRGY